MAPAWPESRPGPVFSAICLEQFACHSLSDIDIRAAGDLHVGEHHTVEDTGIALGRAVRQALGDRIGIARFADLLPPMDEAATFCAIARSDPRCDIKRQLRDERASIVSSRSRPPPEPKPDASWFDAEIPIGTL